MKPRALIIYNPMAGSKLSTFKKEMIFEILKAEGWEHDFFETQKTEKQPLEPFAKNHYDKIVVSGGDGTVSEVISFMVHHKIKAPLIILPQGSANILAVSLKIPLNPKSALKMGLKNEAKALDVMNVNGKYHGMIAVGLGYDSLVMEQTTRQMKRKWGVLAYLSTILKTIFFYRGQPYKLNVDGKREVVYAKALMVFNLLPLGKTSVAEYLVGNQVHENDGELNVAALNPRPVLDKLFIRRRMKVFSGKKIVIQQKNKGTFHIDGDVHQGKTVTVEVIPRAVNIIHP